MFLSLFGWLLLFYCIRGEKPNFFLYISKAYLKKLVLTLIRVCSRVLSETPISFLYAMFIFYLLGTARNV